MNAGRLAESLRQRAEQMDTEREGEQPQNPNSRDDSELVRVLARIVAGKTPSEAFGAPGDWGYSTPIGKALAEK